MKMKCLGNPTVNTLGEHTLKISCSNLGLFGSKIKVKQFEKIESALNGYYVKLPFGVRIVIPCKLGIN